MVDMHVLIECLGGHNYCNILPHSMMLVHELPSQRYCLYSYGAVPITTDVSFQYCKAYLGVAKKFPAHGVNQDRTGDLKMTAAIRLTP
eukprot:jgi/Chrzof1/4747/Cz14g24230.t1